MSFRGSEATVGISWYTCTIFLVLYQEIATSALWASSQ